MGEILLGERAWVRRPARDVADAVPAPVPVR